MLERLTTADASNVELDGRQQVNVFLLAGLLSPGGFVAADGAADLAALRSAIAARVAEDPSLRRFGQRVGAQGRHLVWEDCPADLEQQIRLREPVAGPAGLAALTAELMTTPLPRDRPLWELLIVPGKGQVGPGVVLRVHHAVADGVAGVRLVHRLFSAVPHPTPTSASAPPSRPRRRPSLRHLAIAATRITAVLRPTVGPTPLLGAISARRGVAFADVELSALAAGARAAGGTINDALLSAVAGAARAALTDAGETVPEVLPASVPVALPDRGGSGNAVGVMVVPLPTEEPDPLLRIPRIAESTKQNKAEARRQGTFELTRTRWTTHLFDWLARRQRFIALFVTNVRGPAEPLLVAGAPLEQAWAVAPIYGNVRLGIAAFSYAGGFSCAAHLDADALNGEVFGQTLRTELAAIAAHGSTLRS